LSAAWAPVDPAASIARDASAIAFHILSLLLAELHSLPGLFHVTLRVLCALITLP
jgi:hypothetical protein